MPTRRQLSLFVSELEAAALESLRLALDPVQHRLIPAHVTLGRDDEIDGWSVAELRERVLCAATDPLTLTFGRAEPFSGHGILLPCIAGEPAFQALRQRLLGEPARAQRPHLTLAHPRNPRAPGNSLTRALQLPPSLRCTFAAVRLIEQVAATTPWRVLAEHPLAAS